jgi:hypothetical protein
MDNLADDQAEQVTNSVASARIRIALHEVRVPRGAPVKIISDEVSADGIRRITRQHGPIPIDPDIREAIVLLHRTMNDKRVPMDDRLEAAKTIAPYFHPTFEIIQIDMRTSGQEKAS